MDTTLILIGVGCIIGAIIGGGVKLVQIELSQVPSLWRQALLAIFGAILILWGLVSGGQLRLAGPQPAAPTAPDQVENAQGSVQQSPDRERASSNDRVAASGGKDEPGKSGAVVANTSPDAVAAQDAAALPSKVDIFWCMSADGGAVAQGRAQRIADALRATGAIARVRVRPLTQQTNAQPDYQIVQNIVRFDPGEHPAAQRLAGIATDAAGAPFAPAPALPGSPSIDYISIFACAPQ